MEPSSLGLIYLMVESPISRDVAALDISMFFSKLMCVAVGMMTGLQWGGGG